MKKVANSRSVPTVSPQMEALRGFLVPKKGFIMLVLGEDTDKLRHFDGLNMKKAHKMRFIPGDGS
jgi:hypothetical protein